MVERRLHYIISRRRTTWLLSTLLMLVGVLAASCSRPKNGSLVDRWNDLAYDFHYRNLDSTRLYAQKAYDASADYGDGRSEALNNLAFADMAKMDYAQARKRLNEVGTLTDNQIELLVADVQMMRLCQRESKNKDFYTHRQRASYRLNRIREEEPALNQRQRRRLVYAQSEYSIVASTYFYYVGLERQSIAAFNAIDPTGDIVKDTAQLLNYYYNIGSGGLIKLKDPTEVARREFENLMHCYLLARQNDYPYWTANALQAMSDHLRSSEGPELKKRFRPELQFVNTDQMPDSLLAGNLAQRSMQMFHDFGDVYQTAGAYRTLGECYWAIGDYASSIACLETALSTDSAVSQAPDLVASIREQLCLAYSAIDDKVQSDANRNIFLDMQEITRQDRELEARAEQLDWQSNIQNAMIGAVVAMILLVATLLFVFAYMGRRSDRNFDIDTLLQPLARWEKENQTEEEHLQETFEQIEEQTAISRQQLLDNKHRNVEQRAKVSLAFSIIPLISRISHEVSKLGSKETDADSQRFHLEYATELTQKINEYNAALTQWIQMRQGEISLHVESFSLQDLFNVVARAKTEYTIKGIHFRVEPTTATVKADKILTLFMINTMAENARKATPEGGSISVSCQTTADYAEISINDTGRGISAEDLPTLFSHKFKPTAGNNTGNDRPHGFGLVNCKGIIEKYRKLSTLFRVCDIGAESELGRGSRFWFRLPLGMVRGLILLLLMATTSPKLKAETMPETLLKASQFADSAYFSNINGTYAKTITFADSCIHWLNQYHLSTHPRHALAMRLLADDGGQAAELQWFHQRENTDYTTILDIRNETAVAALALHDWQLYEYNNKVYTQLFREYSADNTLTDYVRVMQRSESNKNVAIIILVLLLFTIFPAYYLLYYRHRMQYKLCRERVDAINQVLLSQTADTKKLAAITGIWLKPQDKSTAEGKEIEALAAVVEKVRKALQQNISHSQQRSTDLTLAQDELAHTQREKEKFYVSNNILDNCLSTLKHETMYYPSRIAQLLADPKGDTEAIREVVSYYNELYTILCEQALRQTEHTSRYDAAMADHLLSLLTKLNGGLKPAISVAEAESPYLTLTLQMQGLQVDEKACQQLFTPSTPDFRFLVCKQIVREWGDQLGARGCGIRAIGTTDGQTNIEIKLTQQIWKNSKLSSLKTSPSN